MLAGEAEITPKAGHAGEREAAAGALPASCPALVVDRDASIFLNAPKVSQWLGWTQGPRLRATFAPPNRTASSPCVVHAPGASKWFLETMHRTWREHAGSSGQLRQRLRALGGVLGGHDARPRGGTEGQRQRVSRSRR